MLSNNNNNNKIRMVALYMLSFFFFFTTVISPYVLVTSLLELHFVGSALAMLAASTRPRMIELVIGSNFLVLKKTNQKK